MKFSIVLPCYNEEQNIQETLDNVFAWIEKQNFDVEVVIVNDGSEDKTEDVLNALQATYSFDVLHHSENKGYASALITGLDHATGDVVGFMDSDGQFHAEDFSRLLQHSNRYSCVIGRRKKRADPALRSLTALCYGLLVKTALHILVRDINCGMKIMKRDVWQKCKPTCATGALFNAELFLHLKQHRIKWHQVDVHHFPRKHGHPTGLDPQVILCMFKELRLLRKQKNSAS